MALQKVYLTKIQLFSPCCYRITTLPTLKKVILAHTQRTFYQITQCEIHAVVLNVDKIILLYIVVALLRLLKTGVRDQYFCGLLTIVKRMKTRVSDQCDTILLAPCDCLLLSLLFPSPEGVDNCVCLSDSTDQLIPNSSYSSSAKVPRKIKGDKANICSPWKHDRKQKATRCL